MRRAVVAVSLVLLAGCGSDPGPQSPAQQWTPPAATTLPVPQFQPPMVDRSSPDLVARAVLETWFGWNTNTDSSAADAPVRASGLLTAGLAGDVSETRPVSPGAQWLRWAEQSATVTVQVAASVELVPPQSETEAYRVFDVTQTFRDPRGAQVDERVVTVGVVLTATNGVWSVSKVEERTGR